MPTDEANRIAPRQLASSAGMSIIFNARYPGRCGTCAHPIEAGDPVRYADDTLVHSDCADTTPAPRAAPEIACPRCWLTSCDCGREE